MDPNIEEEKEPTSQEQELEQELETEEDFDLSLDETSEELIAQDIVIGEEIQKIEAEFRRETAQSVVPPHAPTETSDDPVRLYLKEIGRVDLLDVDHEFWLEPKLKPASAWSAPATNTRRPNAATGLQKPPTVRSMMNFLYIGRISWRILMISVLTLQNSYP